GAQRALADRALRVALDLDDRAVPVVDELPAADPAVGTAPTRNRCPLGPRTHGTSAIRHHLGPRAARAITELPQQGPAPDPVRSSVGWIHGASSGAMDCKKRAASLSAFGPTRYSDCRIHSGSPEGV